MSNGPIIVWFRNDLRLSDHPALSAAAREGQVLPVFILDDESPGSWAAGGASRWWLHHSLATLSRSIAERGGNLLLRRGVASEQLAQIAGETGAVGVYFSQRFEPWARKQEAAVHESLSGTLAVKRYNGSLLRHPDQVQTGSGGPYRVFTPFWKSVWACRDDIRARPEPSNLDWYPSGRYSDDLNDWELLPKKPDWAGGIREAWEPGERASRETLRRFFQGTIETYKDDRDRPALAGTSKLSPYLHFGEISPKQVWQLTREAAEANEITDDAVWPFLREVGWREFSYHLLYHFPTLPDANYRDQFDRFPWRESAADLAAWQSGQTGYPVVDAGMRELWHTGWMHNRVRMIVASFLTKHLLIHWRHGEDWFWDTLVDADLANNSASWQWVAGSGADAAPYFRIFNPFTQGEKFDKQGDYVRRWVPEVAGLPNKFVHRPWEAPQAMREAVGLRLGETYPEPLVDHKFARQRALDSYQTIKG